MNKVGGIISIIAGIFGVIAAVSTLIFGGIGSVFNAPEASTIVSLGWGGVIFSFLVIVFGALAFSKPKFSGLAIIVSSLFGVVLGGTLVAICMALSFIGGTLTLFGKNNNKLNNVPEQMDEAIDKRIGYLIFLCFIVIAVSIVLLNIGENSNNKLPVLDPLADLEKETVSDLRPQGELASMFAFGSNNTDLQRENKLKEIIGKVVQWQLPVYDVKQSGNGYVIQTQTNLGILEPNIVGTFIYITPRNNQDKQIVEGLKTGDIISFKGRISDSTMRNLDMKPAILALSSESEKTIKIEVDRDSVNKTNIEQQPVASLKQESSEAKEISQQLPENFTSIEVRHAESIRQPEKKVVSEVTSPDIKVGDVFIIESTNPSHPENNSKTERTVVSTEGGVIEVAVINLSSKSGKKRVLKFNNEWNLIATRNADNSGLDYSPPLKYFGFPLSPGKSWQQTSTETNIKTGAIRKHKISGVVGDWEDITVPAGTFHAIKIILNTEVVSPITGEKSTGTDTSWYAPNAKRSVKSEVTSRNEIDSTEQKSVAQLISFNAKNTSKALHAPTDVAAAFKAAGYTLKGKQWRSDCDDPGRLSYTPGAIEEVRDLNGDGLPEAVITEGGTYCYGITGTGFSLVSKQANDSWKLITSATGIPNFLATKGIDDWPDIEIGGPGFCFPVVHWNGREYILQRYQYENKPCRPE